MERLSEITFRLPASPEASAFLDQLRTLLADVTYAESEVADRLTLTPPQPAGARPLTAFELVDLPTPEIAFDTGRSIGVRSDGTTDRPEPSIDLAELARRLRGNRASNWSTTSG